MQADPEDHNDVVLATDEIVAEEVAIGDVDPNDAGVVLATDEIVAEEVAIGDVDANDPGLQDTVAGEPIQEELLDTGALQRNIEAVLFVASEAMSIKALAKLTGAEESEVTMALARIDSEFAERGLVLREVAGGYRFASSPAARVAVEAYLLPPKTNLSPAALETLAIVAYNEPVTKTQVEEIRGVSSDSVIATLLDRRFIAESGRKEAPGRPMLYKTTTEFLEAFGLNSLGDLPAVDFDALQSREVELPMTQSLSETEDVAPEAHASGDAVADEAVAEESAADEGASENTPTGHDAGTPPDQEAEELSLA